MASIALLPLLLAISFVHETIAAPLRAPDINTCLYNNAWCCIPTSKKEIVDFKPSLTNTPRRVRRPAHLLDEEYKKKLVSAMTLSRQLPEEDPWNFNNQAAIHCAYSAGAYTQLGHPSLNHSVHNSWMFLPFHRAYLYFHERILGKLINDETFALPFWDWDATDGMGVPSIYNDSTSPLYDDTRLHLNKSFDILSYGGNEVTKEGIIKANLGAMYRVLVQQGNDTQFIGKPFREGNPPPNADGKGPLEQNAHAVAHQVTSLDMSQLASAAYDPIFFAHHANVDRMWEVWRDIYGRKGSCEINDADWLNSSFLFWDENKQLVRIKVHDVLDIEKLGYTYEKVPLQWLNESCANVKEEIGTAPLQVQATSFSRQMFPLVLQNTSLRVPLLRKDKIFQKFINAQKEEEEEVILIEGIRFNANESVWFDVYVSAQSTARLATDLTSVPAPGTIRSVWAGNFANVPTSNGEVGEQDHRLAISLRSLLKSLDAEQKNTIMVTLVPRKLSTQVQIGSVEVKKKSQL